MAHYQRIEYRIGKDGKVVETVIDGSGAACIQATAALEAALGDVEKRELLPQYDEGEEGFTSETIQQSVE